MQPSAIVPTFELVIAIAVAVIAVALVSRHVDVPRPVFLAVGGLAIGVVSRLIPGAPAIELPPSIALYVFLPPLLFTAAFGLPFGVFRANFRAIALLAVGLVLATTAGVAGLAHWSAPDLPLASAFVLGAIVAPPDPVAASAVVQRMGIRNQLVGILEGEGLVNDATAIVAYRLAVEAAATGRFSWGVAAAEFAMSTVVGIAVGLVVGWITAAIQRRVDDAPLETAITLVAPYVAYAAADRAHASGVLAVVTLGFYLGGRVTEIASASTRLTARTMWNTIDFLMQGAVFVLIGVQLGQAIPAGVPGRLFVTGAVVSLGAIAIRMGWMYGAGVVRRAVSRLRRATRAGGGHPTNARELTVLGWAGMRGVVSLALALALPLRVRGGAPFPHRGEVILLTYMVILATLVLQGLSLGRVVRATKVADPRAAERDEERARTAAARAAEATLSAYLASGALAPAQRLALRQWFEGAARLDRSVAEADGVLGEARSALIATELDVVLRLRADGTISDEIASRLEAELEIELVRLRRGENLPV